MQSYIIVAAIVAATAIGDYALKCASVEEYPLRSHWFHSGALLYAATAIGWLILMQNYSLAQIGVLYSAGTIIALTIVGFAFFDERLTSRQFVGLCAALLSVIMIGSNG